jgi:hypothetical protein
MVRGGSSNTGCTDCANRSKDCYSAFHTDSACRGSYFGEGSRFVSEEHGG